MNKDRDNQKIPPNIGKSRSEQNLVSSRNAIAKPGEVEIAQPKQGIWRTYDVTDGLPGGVLCLLQDQKGYLWLGTRSGLCRYDGQEFITYTTADGLAADAVQAICEDRLGRLWIGTGCYNTTGEGVSCYDGGRFVTYTTKDGLAHNNVSDIYEDSQDQLWFATSGGVSRFDGERFVTYTVDDGSEQKHVSAICEDHKGRLWFGTRGDIAVRYPGMERSGGRGALRYDGERFVAFTIDDGLLNDHIGAVCCDSRGRLWFGSSMDEPSGGLFVYDGEHFANYTASDWLPGLSVLAIYEDRRGRLWIGTFDGGAICIHDPESLVKSRNCRVADCEEKEGIRCRVADCEEKEGIRAGFSLPTQPDETGKEELVSGRRLRGKRRNQNSQEAQQFTIYTTDDGLLSNRVKDIIEDREGSIWFASLLSGLTRFDPGTLQALAEEPVSEILFQDREGKLWFGNGSVLCCLCNGQQRLKTFNTNIEYLLEDSSGGFWISTRGDGLYRYDSRDAVWESAGQRFGKEEGLGNGAGALLETRDGTLWVGVNYPGRLCRFDGEGFSTISTPHEVMFRLFEDSCGRIWMGGWQGGGLSCYDGKSLKTYTTADGLSGDKVQSILEDDAGNLWIGTDPGLCRFDGKRFSAYGKEQGLTSRTPHQCSVKDATGQLWFGTLAGGLYRYDGRHFQRLAAADGLPHNSVTWLIPQSDGSMIIGTYGGIAHYRPTATIPPGIEIREVMADEVYENPTELELTTTEADLLTISYHGMSLATQKMRYSYILEGYAQALGKLEDEWQDTWDSQVSYEDLPIGEYTFKVIAINRDLVPSESPAILKLTVIPDPRDARISTLQTELHHLRREIGDKYHFQDIIGRSTKMRNVRALMERAIDSGLTVLITGETGTGKELVAKAIHYNSPRKDGPMLNRNCGAIPRELVASELFGHHKGAFTGADEDRIGLFEAASGGTVFLDEIGEMPQDAQVHLLRVLDDGKIRRIGGNIAQDVDVRVIAATNRDLRAEVEAGRFREDLYYRLSVLSISMPPLRERPEDIPVLAEHFLQEYSARQKKELDGFAPGVLGMFQSYTWRGNVRELQNAINVAVAFAEEGQQIQFHHFPRITQGGSLIQEATQAMGQGPLRYRELVNQFERRCIEHALRECNGNRTQTAKMLGIERKHLYEKMKSLHIDIPANISPQSTDE